MKQNLRDGKAAFLQTEEKGGERRCQSTEETF